MEIEEFSREFLQDIVAESDVNGQFHEDIFFEKSCELLTEAGELETADRVPYRHPRGIRIDGYGGEPNENTRTLSLIVLDFHLTPGIGNLTRTEMNAAFRRLSNYINKTLTRQWRDALEETNPAFALADLVAQRWKSIAKIRLLLVSNRKLSERVDGHPAGDFDGKQVTYSVWDIRRLYDIATRGTEREELVIDLAKDFGGPIPVLRAQQLETELDSYLAVMPGKVLAEIYDRWGARLLEQNVRVFLQARGKVNRGIRTTIENNPSMFFPYNNGITVTAENVQIVRESDQLLLRRLHNFQIVNGGQTTASIHNAKLRKHDLSKIFVQMKLSVVSAEKATEVVPKISEYANSQNRVSAADFFSNHSFHVRIEEFSRRIRAPSPDGTFRQSKWFYERARGQYADARTNKTPAQRGRFDLEYPRRQFFTKTDLAKFINVWEGQPHDVSRGAQKNFANFAQRIGKEWEKSQDEFNEAWYRTAIAKAIIFKSTERIVSNQPWYQGGYRANIVAYTVAKIAHDVKGLDQAINFEHIWHQQSQGTELDEVIAAISEKVHEVLIHPRSGTSNVTEWAKTQACWETVKNLVINWPDSFTDSLISIHEQRDNVRSARRDQKELKGIEAQTAILEAGSEFWSVALSWGQTRRGLLTPKETGILKTATHIPATLPTEKQSIKILEILNKLHEEGFPHVLPS